MRTAMFTARAAIVLKAGHVPKKSVMPRADTTEEARASCLHASLGRTMPQKDIEAATNPIVDRIQKALATAFAAWGERDGNSHDRAGSQAPVAVPRLLQLTAIATSAPMCPRP